jgi:hypothetical protein
MSYELQEPTWGHLALGAATALCLLLLLYLAIAIS